MSRGSPSAVRRVLNLLRQTITRWSRRGAPTQAAAIAFFALFSIAPVMLLAIAIGNLIFDREVVQGRLVHEFGEVMGHRAAGVVQTLLQNATTEGEGPLARIGGFVALALGATAVFVQLQSALNRIWDVERAPGRLLHRLLRKRLLSFALVVAIGFLLLVSLVISAATAAFADRLDALIHTPASLVDALNLLASAVVFTALFAVMFRFLPDVELPWEDVGVGAVVTALLLTAGRWAIGLYLGHSALASTYGAAASLVMILLWIYYAALIVLFGAAFTRAWSEIVNRRQSVPEEGARRTRLVESELPA